MVPSVSVPGWLWYYQPIGSFVVFHFPLCDLRTTITVWFVNDWNFIMWHMIAFFISLSCLKSEVLLRLWALEEGVFSLGVFVGMCIGYGMPWLKTQRLVIGCVFSAATCVLFIMQCQVSNTVHQSHLFLLLLGQHLVPSRTPQNYYSNSSWGFYGFSPNFYQ